MKYKSKSQEARVKTEKFVSDNMFCPLCGSALNVLPKNTKVYDFSCSNCNQTYQLKSTSKKIGKKLIGSEYYTFIDAIKNNSIPNFLIMEYSIENDILIPKEIIFIPKVFIDKEVIEKREPLSESAKRSGWTGYSLLLGSIPSYGKIHIIKNGILEDKEIVISESKKISSLYTIDSEGAKWRTEILKIIDKLNCEFTLQEVYNNEIQLQSIFPNNNHIKEKIRQQLQFIRDDGILIFQGDGKYIKT